MGRKESNWRGLVTVETRAQLCSCDNNEPSGSFNADYLVSHTHITHTTIIVRQRCIQFYSGDKMVAVVTVIKWCVL